MVFRMRSGFSVSVFTMGTSSNGWSVIMNNNVNNSVEWNQLKCCGLLHRKCETQNGGKLADVCFPIQ